MNMKNICGNNNVFIIIILIAAFIFSCTSSETKTGDEIVKIEGQISNIDQQIASLIASKKSRSNTVILHERGHFDFAGRLIDQSLNEPIDRRNNEIDTEIYKLKSQREMLVVNLAALRQSLNK
jgi:hypothetical protein